MSSLRQLLALIRNLFSGQSLPAAWQTLGVQSRQTFTVMATQVFTRSNVRGWQNPWVKPLPILEVVNPDPSISSERKRRRVILQYEAGWPLLLGNSRQCEITIRNARVSRSHVRIDRQGDSYILSSPNTTQNGTFKSFGWWRWRRIDNSPGSYPLCHGDAFTLGPLGDPKSVILRFWAPPALAMRFVLALRSLVLFIFSSIITLTLIFTLILALVWSQIPGEYLPESVEAPLVFYARDRKTPIVPELDLTAPPPPQSLDQFPALLPQAVLASEDSYYRWHIGINPISIGRAAIFNLYFRLQGIDQQEGGSTLTQQVARTVYSDWVGRDSTLGRKLKEAAVALKLNFSHSKDEILTTYLNTVFLGRANHGFSEAAQDYFGKPVNKLDLSEIATLVALLPGPNGFDLCGTEGLDGLGALQNYRSRVIQRMQDQGVLDTGPLRLTTLRNLFDPRICSIGDPTKTLIPRVYDSLLYRELYTLLDEKEVDLGNLIVETTLDPQSQRLAQTLINQSVNHFNPQGVGEGALVSLEAGTGSIRALVVSREPQPGSYATNPETNEEEGPFFYDYATIDQLSPGSTFKVFAYGAALEKGISPNQYYSCTPFEWAGESFGPKDWPDSSCGVDTNTLEMGTALGVSDNLVALKVAQDAGLRGVVDFAKRLGIKSPLTPEPRLVLGQSPVRLLEMTGAFGVLANQGKGNRPHLISRIIDISDRACRDNLTQYDTNPACAVLYAYEGDDRSGLKPDFGFNRSVISPEVAQNLTTLLAAVVAEGGTAAGVDIPGAVGKTGTSDGARDLWFIGYVPGDRVTGVWLGNGLGQREPTEATSKDAAALWQQYMKSLGY